MSNLLSAEELRSLVARKLEAHEEITIEEAKQCVEALRSERAESVNKSTRRTRKTPAKQEASPLDILNNLYKEAI